MAKLARNEETRQYVEYVFDGVAFAMHVFGARNLDGHALGQWRIPGVTSVAIVTERVTWRGKNGKRTRQEIARQPIARPA